MKKLIAILLVTGVSILLIVIIIKVAGVNNRVIITLLLSTDIIIFEMILALQLYRFFIKDYPKGI